MPERPLLLFPAHETADRSDLKPGWSHFHKPAHDAQSSRLAPIFTQLQNTFNARRLEIQSGAGGIEPDQVLVIETVGNVENFANAVKKIAGLEWMGELIEEITPDTDFFPINPDGTRKENASELSGRLYFVMTNQQALREMLSLWQSYQTNEKFIFPRGLTKFRDVFKYLKNIRTWGIQDRFEDTGVRKAWLEELQLRGQAPVKFEVELWYRKTLARRQAAQQQLTNFITARNGRIIAPPCDIEEISYHAVLAELPANAIQAILDNPNVDLIKCDDVMFFRPRGQVCAGDKPLQINPEETTFSTKPLPRGNPVIAIFDGLPLANHQLLAGRLQIDDPEDFASTYQASEQVHGTAMTSLIVHGDLNDNQPPLSTPVYVRPVMRPIPWSPSPPNEERMPAEVLAVDVIHRAVKRIFDGDSGQSPVAPTVRIINFSICDYQRQFAQVMSPWGRLIDWLSAKYNVLFIISAGNHSQSINLGMSVQNFSRLPEKEREAIVVKAVCHDRYQRKLLSPSESMNSVTVGASHYDNSTIPSSQRINPYQSPTTLPSPISAFGSGYRRSIKPDLIFCGGRLFYEASTSAQNQIDVPIPAAPGNKVASPGSAQGQLSSSTYLCGTSNATALITRSSGIYYDSLAQIFADNGIGNDSPFITSIIKAMIVHGCSWEKLDERLTEILNGEDKAEQIITNWIGYGIPDIGRLLECTAQRASLIGFGELLDGEAHIFKLPLPPALGSKVDWRKLTITLAWLSPIAPSTQKYRGASLWFDIKNSLVPKRRDADYRAVKRGTVQHEIFTGNQAVPISEGESIEIKVNCRQEAAKITAPVRYGLVVSLEVADGIAINVYDEVRSRISIPVVVESSEQV